MMTASQERQPILVNHTLQVDTGRCYFDGTPTQTVCFICNRYACKAHSANCRTHEISDWKEYGCGCVQMQYVVENDLGAVCLDHKDAGSARPGGYPKYQVARWAKILCVVLVVLVVCATIGSLVGRGQQQN